MFSESNPPVTLAIITERIMGKFKEANFDLILKHQERKERQKPFLAWAARKAPDLYDRLVRGETRFKDEWLGPKPPKPWELPSRDDVPF